MVPKNYDHCKVRGHCAALGLKYDWIWAHRAAESAQEHKLTQAQFDAAMILHAEHMAVVFTPRYYTFWQRIGLAFHFLFRSNLKKN